jgi:hypothetical protein
MREDAHAHKPKVCGVKKSPVVSPGMEIILTLYSKDGSIVKDWGAVGRP